MKSKWMLVVGVALLLSAERLAGNQFADPPKGEPATEKFRKAFEQTLNVEFNGISLASAVESLRQQTKLNIVLDRASLMSLGVNADEFQVQLKLQNVKLRSVLKQLLSQCNLAYVIDQDLMLITIDEVAIQRQVRQRVSFAFDQAPLERALKDLSRETGTNLVLDPRQAGRGKEAITLSLEDVPLDVAVRLVAELGGLRSVRQGNVLFVTSKEVAADLRKQEDASPFPSHGNWMERMIMGGGIGGMPIPVNVGGAVVPPLPGVPLPADPPPVEKPAEKPPENPQ